MRDVIRGPARWVLRLPGRDDRGVVGVLTGLVIGTVLLGLGALVIDVGQLYQERSQLQSGADAAALAVAKSCATSTCTASGAMSTAVTYADDNAKDGVAGVPHVCGSSPLATCPATVPSSTYDHQINLANFGNKTSCAAEASGSDGAGAFGWAVDQTGTCGIFTNTATFPADTGASAGSTCQGALSAAYASRKPIFLPVYTKATGTGSNTVLTLKGFAAFVVTGYSLPGFSASDWLKSANNTCSYKCIDGYFTKALIPGTASEGGTYLGAAAVGLSG